MVVWCLQAVTKTGQRITDIAVNDHNISEILRIFIRCRNGKEDEVNWQEHFMLLIKTVVLVCKLLWKVESWSQTSHCEWLNVECVACRSAAEHNLVLLWYPPCPPPPRWRSGWSTSPLRHSAQLRRQQYWLVCATNCCVVRSWLGEWRCWFY